MQELNEKLSLLLDDELDPTQAKALLGKINNQAQLDGKLRRYQLIGQAMKNDQCVVIKSDFAEQIHQRLRNEPIRLVARKKPVLTWQSAGLAAAASLFFATIWLVEKPSRSINPYKTVAQQQVQAEKINPRFNEYLQAHDNSLYVSSAVGVQRYVQTAGYQQ